MALLSEAKLGAGGHETRYFVDILTQNSAGNWVLCLPTRLSAFQDELELLLGRAFAGRPRCQENLELAQQLTLNWCISKCKKQGITLEECLREDGSR
ncbi:MAG: hypothetical protein K2X27_19500 [Candidatus Obscuribacterales bacterium]|nr:hypothetical protein [Candidatus Obscuribacterales bacterium]